MEKKLEARIKELERVTDEDRQNAENNWLEINRRLSAEHINADSHFEQRNQALRLLSSVINELLQNYD